MGWDIEHRDVDGKQYVTTGVVTAGDVTVDVGSLDNLLFGVAATVQDMLEAIDEFTFGDLVSYAVIADQKAYNVNGGDFSAGADRTRDLNTELSDADNIVSISSNQFTLQAGTYIIRWQTISHAAVNGTVSWLYNTSDSTEDITGSPTYGGNDALSIGKGKITIAGAKVFEIRHRSTGSQASSGFGQCHNISGHYNYYTIVEILKIG